ncbi:hypothetical protein V491_07351 [Pseudogymnoascus sp. VKM F-3775]|nr:hypothetical protein V491_07351 [Pseudogymnoascus sp. VKM F-3775]
MPKLKHPYAWLFCSFAALGACLYGYDGVYFTGVSAMDIFVEHFGTQKADGSYEISSSQLSLMTSVINIGELVGSLSAAPLNDYLGRKGVFLIASIAIIIGVILQLVTDHNTSYIMGGRIILGYGEIAPAAIRGQLLMCWQLVISISQIIAAAINRGTEGINSTVAYRVPMGVQVIFPVIVLAGLWWVPESPRWLLRKGKQESAKRALALVHRGEQYTPDEDVNVLQQDIDDEALKSAESSWMDLIRDPIERRKVVYSAGALIAQQINGIQWFYYFGTVFSKAIGLNDPFLMTLIVFIIQVVVVFVAVLFANKLPRRPLLLITTGLMTVSIFVVGCLGIPGNTPSPTIGKVIFAFIIIEITAFNFAWGPLGWTILKMAVGRNRNKIYAISVACFWITVWATVFTLPYLYYNANLGPKTGFVYTGLCFISLSYVYFCVGEVTGRTMEEINGFFAEGIPAKQWRHQPSLTERAANTNIMGGDEEKSGGSMEVERSL